MFRTFGAKVCEIFVLMIQQFHSYESSWNVRSRGTKVPRERMLHGTKVLGTFAPEERQFHRSESSKERMFHGTKVPREQKFSLGSFRSRERKCRGTKRPGIVWASVQPHFANCAANWIVCAAHCTNRAAHLMKQRCLFL